MDKTCPCRLNFGWRINLAFYSWKRKESLQIFCNCESLFFRLAFLQLKFNLTSNAGYPPTYTLTQPGITISRANILNASLTNIVQDIERTPTYKFLTVQFGATTAETIKLDTSFPGGLVQVDFYGTNSDAHYQFSSSSGYPYHVNVGSSKTTFITRFHPQAQPAKDSFAQIDALGLQWFYDRALDLAQNRTGSVPNIDALSFTFTFEGRGYVGYDRSYSGYEGITVQIIGSQQTVLPDGSITGHGVLIADFKPDGTLIYMSKPNSKKIRGFFYPRQLIFTACPKSIHCKACKCPIQPRFPL